MIAFRERRRALLVGAVVLIGYGYFHHYYEKIPNPNETSRLYLTLAVVDDGTLAIDGPIARHGGVSDRAQRSGRSYCDKAPGLSFLAVPFYAAAKAVAYVFGYELTFDGAHLVARWGAVILPAVIFCYYLYLFLAPILPSPNLRMLLVLLYAMATPARIYGVLFFGHETSAVLSAGGLMLLHGFGRASGWRGTGSVLLAGLMLGAGFATEYPTFLTVAIACGLALRAARPLLRRLPILAIAIAVPVGLCLLYNYLAFGNPFSPGYSHLASSFAEVHAKGLFGVTTPKPEALFGAFLSIERGLFVLSPWLLAAPVGLYFLFRQRESRSLFWVSVAAVVAYAYFISSFGYWVGGDSAGPRHLTPLVPFLVLPVAALMERIAASTRESPRLLLSGLFVLSIALVNFVAMTFSYFSPELANPFRDVTLELWREGGFPHSLGTLLGLEGLGSAVPYLVGLAVLSIFACLAWPREPWPHAVRRRVLSFGYAGAVAALGMLALLSVRPEARNAWSSNELHRYLKNFTPSTKQYRLAAEPTRTGLTLRGNHLVLLGEQGAAWRLYQEARRAP